MKSKFEPIIKLNNVIGINIATRCDAITEETLNYLEELNKRTFLVIELGLQSIHESTSKLINRGHTLKEFDDMVKKIRDRNINVVVHIINGLPYNNSLNSKYQLTKSISLSFSIKKSISFPAVLYFLFNMN